MNLVQGNWTVREYITQFERFSHFAHHIVDTPQKKVKQFHRGLDPHLRHMMIGHLNQSFEGMVGLATSLEKDSRQNQEAMQRP